jgi:hypothetical protein
MVFVSLERLDHARPTEELRIQIALAGAEVEHFLKQELQRHVAEPIVGAE